MQLSCTGSVGVRAASRHVVAHCRHVCPVNSTQTSYVGRPIYNEQLPRWREWGVWNGERLGSELEESLAKDARLQTADLQLLTIAQDCDVRPARHHAHLRDQLDVRQRATTEPDEARRIEPSLEILEAVRDRMSLVPCRG